MTTGPVRVLVVDDELMRAGLLAILSVDEAIEVVGEAQDGRAAAARARTLDPDVVLMDIRMPDVDGIAATRDVLATAPAVKVVILTTFEQDDYIFDALAAGASGFLLKRARLEELLAAIHAVAVGDSLLPPSVTRRVIDRMVHQQPLPDRASRERLAALTPREGEVLELIARGQANREIDARRRGVDGQDPRQAHPDEVAGARPRPCRDLRVRGWHRRTTMTDIPQAARGPGGSWVRVGVPLLTCEQALRVSST